MTVFHVIRSVKGGSGKTTFALHKVVDFCSKDKLTLYIDADVHASETRNLLLRELQGSIDNFMKAQNIVEAHYFSFYDGQYSEQAAECPEKCTKHTLNTYMHPYKGFFSKVGELKCPADLVKVTIKKYTTDNEDGITFEEKTESNVIGKVHFIFSDPSTSGRHVFGNLFQSSGKSAIGAGAYIAKMKSIFKYVTEEGYANVVIDMPPGSDTFSEHLLDCLIRFIGESKDNSLNIYYVSSADEAHIRTSVEAAIEHLHTMRLKAADSISFVYNTVNKDSTISGKDEILKKIEKAFNSNKSYENIEFELDRLSYPVSDYDEKYYQCSCGIIKGLFLNANDYEAKSPSD